jgi:hypothetical protein
MEPNDKRKKELDKYHTYIDDILKESAFDKIINQMLAHDIPTNLSFEPVRQYKD